jgi:hypothetical protein
VPLPVVDKPFPFVALDKDVIPFPVAPDPLWEFIPSPVPVPIIRNPIPFVALLCAFIPYAVAPEPL